MQMLSRALLLGAALLVRGQARPGAPRAPPSFQNSIVNLGKIDIILNLEKRNSVDSLPQFGSQNDMHIEPCPCGFKDPFGSDSPLLKRFQPPVVISPSSHQSCCDFHEELILDSRPNLLPNMPIFPFPLENAVPNSMSVGPMGKKQLEIIFFPQKKGGIQSRRHKGDKAEKKGEHFPKLDKEPAAEYPKLDGIKAVGGRGPEYLSYGPTGAPNGGPLGGPLGGPKSVKKELKEPQLAAESTSPPSDTNIL